MYTGRIYQIMIGAPSDITKEITTVQEVIFEWNQLYSSLHRTVLLPLHWKTHAYPSMGVHPQKNIDKQVVEKSDLLICIFGSRLGSPTDTDISGTVEEIREHIESGKGVMLFFRTKNSVVDISQLIALSKFKESIKTKALLWDYEDEDSFKETLRSKLQLYVNDNWLREEYSQLISIESNQKPTILSEFDNERLKVWVDSNQEQMFALYYANGDVKYIFGSHSYRIDNGADRAEWEDFFERLMKLGFIDIATYDKKGHPLYKLKIKAYDYVKDNLK